MLLSKYNSGVTVEGAIMRDWEVSQQEFVDHFKTAAVGKKDGSYYLMGHCEGDHRRTTQNMKTGARLIVLDCDSRLNDKLDVIKGAPPVEEALKMLQKNSLSYLLYTTHSHKIGFPRYRIIFFPDELVKSEDVRTITEILVSRFNEAGIPLAHTDESAQINQPWYFPRIKDAQSEYKYKYKLAKALPVQAVLAKSENLKKIKEKQKDFRGDLKPDVKDINVVGRTHWTPIDMFLERHNTFEFIDNLLKKHEYIQKYVAITGARYLAPGSESKNAGLTLFKGDDNKWRVASYHGDHDPLARNNEDTQNKLTLDAYDVFMVLEHKGDVVEAKAELMAGHHERLLAYFLKRFVLLASTDHVGNIKTGKLYKAGAPFNRYANNAFWTATSGDPKKEPTKVLVSKEWMGNKNRITVESEGWKATRDRTYFDEDNNLIWNTYRAPEWEKIKSKEYLPLFVNHIKYLMPEEDSELFLMWLAERFQYPHDRAKFTPLHIAPDQGMGRGWIVVLMQRLMGSANCSSTRMSELANRGSEFNEYLYNKRFCAIHEVSEDKKYRYTLDDKIRSILTEPELAINVKNGFKGQCHIYTSFFMMSNHRDCLVLPKEDRRIWVIEGMAPVKPAAYYNKIYEMVNNKQFLREVYWYLKRLDITTLRDMTRPPENSAKARLMGASLSDTEAHFRSLLENPPGLIWTAGLVQTYINIQAGELNPAFYNEATGEVKTLCRKELNAAYNGNPLYISEKSVRLKAHPQFPVRALNDRAQLKKEYQKTIAAVRLLTEEA